MRKIIVAMAAAALCCAVHAESVPLRWIDKTPAYATGQSWGVPFAKGTMNEATGSGWCRCRNHGRLDGCREAVTGRGALRTVCHFAVRFICKGENLVQSRAWNN